MQLSDGTADQVKTLVWTAGTAPNPLLGALACNKDRGRIVANEFLEVPGWPGVWALGDCALIPDPKTGRALSADGPARVARGAGAGPQHCRPP